MFNRTRYFYTAPLVSILLVASLALTVNSLAATGETSPTEAVTMITLRQEPTAITPNPLKVKLGTTIVWFNAGPGAVTVKFLDKLGIACKVPVNFYSDVWGQYETGAIPEGGTASLCFVYKGTYRYEVNRLVTEDGKSHEEIQTGTITAHE